MDVYNGYYGASVIGCQWLAIHVDGSKQSYVLQREAYVGPSVKEREVLKLGSLL